MGGVQCFESPWPECFIRSFLVLDVEPHTPSEFVPGCIIFVSGQLSGGGNMVLELGEAGEPLLIELQLPVGNAPPQSSPYYRSANFRTVPLRPRALVLRHPRGSTATGHYPGPQPQFLQFASQ